jgi:hypothetical protein
VIILYSYIFLYYIFLNNYLDIGLWFVKEFVLKLVVANLIFIMDLTLTMFVSSMIAKSLKYKR